MPVQQLENMYPRTYYIVYPRVQHYCDMMDMNYGCFYCPTKEELDRMCDKYVTRLKPTLKLPYVKK